jgi:hypothetical protein
MYILLVLTHVMSRHDSNTQEQLVRRGPIRASLRSIIIDTDLSHPVVRMHRVCHPPTAMVSTVRCRTGLSVLPQGYLPHAPFRLGHCRSHRRGDHHHDAVTEGARIRRTLE